MTAIRIAMDDAGSSVYSSASYGRATVAQREGSWLCLADDQIGWRLPLVITDATAETPYGYGGIEIGAGASQRAVSAAWEASRDELHARGVAALLLRFPPFARDDPRLQRLRGLELAPRSQTMLVPTLSRDSVWSAMQGRARTAIRKAEREGFSASVRVATPTDVAEGSDFRRLYDSTMERRAAAAHLRFEDSYYESLVSGLDARLRIATVADASGAVVAASLLLADDSVLHYHLSGSDPSAARLGANNLLVWAALQHAVGSEIASMHLGGGLRPDDALMKFKASFGGERVPFVLGRAVLDPLRYEELTETRAAELGCTVEELRQTGFFPAYWASLEIGGDR